MANTITSATAPENVQIAPTQSAQTTAPAQKAPQTKISARRGVGQDTVEISNAVKHALQLMKEASETPWRTAQEASRGDRQIQRLMATEAAEKKL